MYEYRFTSGFGDNKNASERRALHAKYVRYMICACLFYKNRCQFYVVWLFSRVVTSECDSTVNG